LVHEGKRVTGKKRISGFFGNVYLSYLTSSMDASDTFVTGSNVDLSVQRLMSSTNAIKLGTSIMLIKTRFAIIVTAFALAFSSQTFAQNLGPAMDYPTVFGANAAVLGQGDYPNDSFAAEYDPLDIDYDMQVFAPLDLSSYGGAPQIRNGFHASVDLTYMSFSKPKAFGNGSNSANVPAGNEWITGRDYTIGYTNEIGNGWEVDYMKTEGSFWNSQLPDAQNGDAQGARNSLMWTTMRLDRAAINRTFRSKLNQSGYLEPFIGVSYLGLSDKTTQNGEFFRVDDNGTPLDPTDDVLVPGTGVLRQLAQNSAVGGQIGTKYFQQHGRWNVITNFGLSGYYNSETSTATNRVFSEATGTLLELRGTTQSTGTSNSFVPLVDLGIETSYSITRDISLRMGAELLYIWTGLNRANTLPFGQNPNTATSGAGGRVAISDQSATLVGFTFGLEWRH